MGFCLLFSRCMVCDSGNHAARPVHAPAPAGTTVDRSLAAHRAEHRTDLFARLVDAARRVTTFSRHAVIFSCTILERGRGRCDHRSLGRRCWSRRQAPWRSWRSTPAYQNNARCEEQQYNKPEMIHDHVSGISRQEKIFFWEDRYKKVR
jgi:hypothetical protein